MDHHIIHEIAFQISGIYRKWMVHFEQMARARANSSLI
jgi:hypothetical protein